MRSALTGPCSILRTSKLAQRTSQYYCVLQSLRKARPSGALCHKACTKYFPVLLRTSKLARSSSQYYFVLQILHKARPSGALCYKPCTEYFPVLRRTTKLAQSTSQWCFVPQSLLKVFPSTTSYFKACTKYFPVCYFVLQSLHNTDCTKLVPVPLCMSKFAHSTCQHYFVLQSLRKVLPSTTSYYKACTQHVPVVLYTAELAQSTSHWCFVLQVFCSHYNVCCSIAWQNKMATIMQPFH